MRLTRLAQFAQIVRMSYVDPILTAFGGARKLARLLGYAESTVRSWGERGTIPDPQKVEVYRAALNSGIALRPEHFFPDQEAVEYPLVVPGERAA